MMNLPKLGFPLTPLLLLIPLLFVGCEEEKAQQEQQQQKHEERSSEALVRELEHQRDAAQQQAQAHEAESSVLFVLVCGLAPFGVIVVLILSNNVSRLKVLRTIIRSVIKRTERWQES